jgi:hypothetical protein
MAQQPLSGPVPPCHRGLTITLRHTTLGKTPLDEWSALHTDLYQTTHSTQRDKHACFRRYSKLQSQHASADPRLRPRGHWGRKSGNMAAVILNFITKWRWVVSITPQSLYPQERAPETHSPRQWLEPSSGLDSWRWERFLHLLEDCTIFCQTARSLNSIPTELTQFFFIVSFSNIPNSTVLAVME